VASATKETKEMATDVPASAPDPTPSRADGKVNAPSSGGFFTIQKYGQGKWTRLGTAGGVLFLAALTGYQAYSIAKYQFTAKHHIAVSIGAGLFALIIIVGWHLMNKLTSVDFLVATDSEMKKVNWTSRKELIGSTKVVVVFMFLIAFLLFGIDIFFSYFFYFIGVLKSKPF
jgi:preprotein translocase SecE subunit